MNLHIAQYKNKVYFPLHSQSSIILLTRINFLNATTLESKKILILTEGNDTIEQLCDNISQTYSLTFPDDPLIKAVQVKLNDYIIPPQYLVANIFPNETEITVDSYQLGAVAKKVEVPMITHAISYNQVEKEEGPDTPRASPAGHDTDVHQDKEAETLLIKELEKKVRKLSESKEIVDEEKDNKLSGKRKEQKKGKESPLKKKKLESDKEDEANEPLEEHEIIADAVAKLKAAENTRKQLKKESKKEKKTRGKKEAKEEVDFINNSDTPEESSEILQKQVKPLKEQKKTTREKAKSKKATKKKLVKDIEEDNNSQNSKDEQAKSAEKILSSSKKLYNNLFKQ